MRGVYDRAVVHAAALRAAEHWHEAQQVRRMEWIERIADAAWKPKMFAKPQPIGLELATERFDAEHPWFSERREDRLPYACGGSNWFETVELEQARRLILLTDRSEPGTVILEEGEIGCLRPVMPEASA